MAPYILLMKQTKSSFGANLHRIRLEKGLTQTDLGNKVGLSKRMIVHYEKYATNPPTVRIAALADALGVRIDDLIHDNGHNTIVVDHKFARKLERAKRLPESDQQLVSVMIDNLLKKNRAKEPA